MVGIQVLIDEVKLAPPVMRHRVPTQKRRRRIRLHLTIPVKLLDPLIIKHICLFLHLFLMIRLDLIIQVAHIHFLYRQVWLDILAQILIQLRLLNSEVLVLELFAIG